jgi:hypothetical protein
MITVKSDRPPVNIVDNLYTFGSPEFVSDDYHTMEELYDHRRELSRLVLEILDELGYVVWKSKLHSDGTMFEGYFVVGATLPTGLVSYHYSLEHWDTFDVPIVDKAPEYDGHTSKDVLDRLARFLK